MIRQANTLPCMIRTSGREYQLSEVGAAGMPIKAPGRRARKCERLNGFPCGTGGSYLRGMAAGETPGGVGGGFSSTNLTLVGTGCWVLVDLEGLLGGGFTSSADWMA